MTELDDRIREHYRSLQLDDEALLNLSATAPNKRWSLPSLDWQPAAWALAAMMVVALGVGMHGYGSQTERVERMLHEAAMNHTTRLEMEFESDTLSDINTGMSQLAFAVSLPDYMDKDMKILGARYCTISGQLAAHLKLLDTSSDQIISVFMTRAVDELQKIKSTRQQVDGVEVALWHESGVFYAVAAEPSDG